MNCLEQQPQSDNVIQGQDLSLNVRITGANGDPFDVSNSSEIVAVFPTTLAPSYLEKKLSLGGVTLGSGAGGRIVILLTPADTMLLTPGAEIGFEVRITIAAKVTIVQFPLALNVVASLFPTAP